MLNLKQRNPATIQIPDEQDATLFLNEDGNVALKKQNGDVSEIGGGGGASYLVYTALLTQTGTDAPVATVLENTLGGEVVWTRDVAGAYSANTSNLFTQNKTVVFLNFWGDDPYTTRLGSSFWASEGIINIYLANTDGSLTDVLGGGNAITFIEIRVYP